MKWKHQLVLLSPMKACDQCEVNVKQSKSTQICFIMKKCFCVSDRCYFPHHHTYKSLVNQICPTFYFNLPERKERQKKVIEKSLEKFKECRKKSVKCDAKKENHTRKLFPKKKERHLYGICSPLSKSNFKHVSKFLFPFSKASLN